MGKDKPVIATGDNATVVNVAGDLTITDDE
mgnify:CR=1 FL=1